MNLTAPFDIAVHDPKPTLRELHFTFRPEFQAMTADKQVQTLRAYIESLIKQSESLDDKNAQQGIVMVIQITEQIIPPIKNNSLPLHETLIVEIGEDAEGCSMEELLR